MANRICKIVNCPSGDQQIVCASGWLWTGGNAWACLFGKHVMRTTGGNGGTFRHPQSGTMVSVYPVANAAVSRRLTFDGNAETFATDKESMAVAPGDMEEEDGSGKNTLILVALGLLITGYYLYKS